MANYIIDASVVIEYLITGPYTPQIQSFFNGISDRDRLIVPEFALLECTNVIWKQVRFNGMPRTDAQELLKVLRALALRRAPMKRLLGRTLEIALDNTLAAYDSGYPLISIDQPHIRAATNKGVHVIPISSFAP